MEKLRAYYQILGISPGASLEEIKQAYRDSVHVWHPDRFHNNLRLKEKAEAKMREINHAYDKLIAFINDYSTPNSRPDNEEPTSTRVEPAQQKTSDSGPQKPAQKRRQSKPFTLTNESLPNLLLAFNTIVISVLIFAKSSIVYQGDISFWSWVGESTVIFGVAGIITGLAWLIFRKKEAGKVRKSFIIASWVTFCLTVFGQCQSTPLQRSTAQKQTSQQEISTSEALSAPTAPPPSQPPMSSAAPPPSKPVSQMTEKEIRAEHAAAQAIFKKLYPDIFSNTALLAEANKRYYAKLEQGKSITDAMLEAGNETWWEHFKNK